MSGFIALYVAALKEFLRDRMTVFWTLAFPLAFIVLFGTIFAGGDDTQFDVGLVVEDTGATGQQVAETLRQVAVFKVSEAGLEAELAALKSGDRRAVIVLPANLSDQVAQKQPARIPVYYDPANQQTSQIVLTIVSQILEQLDRRLTGTVPMFVVAQEAVQAEQLRSIDFILPGILAMALMQLGLFGTAQPFVALREQGVLRRFSATPLPRWTALGSQIAIRVTIGLAQAVVIVAVGVLIFQVPMLGNTLLLAGFVVLGALAFVSLGYMIAAFARTQEAAAGIASLLSFPMFFLTGIFFPVEFLPEFLQPIIALIPLTYLVDALRQIMIGTNAVYPLEVCAGVLGAWFAATLVVAVRFFKWE